MAVSLLYNPTPMYLYEADGDRAGGAKAYFYLARTTTPLVVYTDNPLTTPHTWPVIADAYGLLPPVYIAKGTEYKVRITDAADNLLYAADGIANPAETSGSGLIVTADQLFQTGYFNWQPFGGERLGWVRANGKTISPPGGGGTERANTDCQALFTFFWDNYSNPTCPVSGGRGPNAAADWDLGTKNIGTLDMRGRGAVGLDDMGNTAASLIQRTATLTTTNGNAVATVSSLTGICVGQYIQASTLDPTGGTTVVSITPPSTIGLSTAATGSGAVSARFSMFRDATGAGAFGGEVTHTQTLAEMPTHNHESLTSDNSGIATNLIDGGSGVYAGGSNRPVYAATGSRFPIGAIASAGSGRPMNLQTPAVVGTWYVKLAIAGFIAMQALTGFGNSGGSCVEAVEILYPNALAILPNGAAEFLTPFNPRDTFDACRVAGRDAAIPIVRSPRSIA